MTLHTRTQEWMRCDALDCMAHFDQGVNEEFDDFDKRVTAAGWGSEGLLDMCPKHARKFPVKRCPDCLEAVTSAHTC